MDFNDLFAMPWQVRYLGSIGSKYVLTRSEFESVPLATESRIIPATMQLTDEEQVSAEVVESSLAL
jgi:hypothetical protein